MKSRPSTRIAIVILLSLGCLAFLFPFLYMLSNSFELFTYVLPFPPRVLPEKPVLDNYRDILSKQHIARYFINSVVVSASTMAAGMLVSTLSAYGFARVRFRGREALFAVYLFTLMIPGVLSIIPQYGLLNKLGLVAGIPGLVLLYVGTGTCGNTFFLRGFFSAVPRELEESVMMDGGSHFTMYRKIVLPLSAPGIATLAVLSFQTTWDDFFTAKVILGSNQAAQTLPIFVQRLHGQYATRWGLVFAATVLMLLPILVLYVAFQKRFVVGGMGEGAIKG
jgi:multiple sugar transport system permease protein